MTHQTGIEASEELKAKISEALKGSLRFLRVTIENETLVPKESAIPNQTWESDLDSMIPPLLNDKTSCYLFYRLDERNAHQNYLWVFFSYIPDYSPVRDKMVYAATKATIRKAFSSGVIVDDVAATSKEELTLEGYKKHMESQKAAPPLTETEEQLKLLDEAEKHSDVGTTTRHSHLHGIQFPIQQAALDALRELKAKKITYVQLSIDTKAEEILLSQKDAGVDASTLHSCFPEDSPRYHFFLFKHTHEGDYQESFLFLYSCPGFKSTIKERMLYSSCKEPLINVAEDQLEINIVKKIELDSGEQVNESYLMDEVHPSKAAYRPKFMKPPPPNNRRRSPSPRR